MRLSAVSAIIALVMISPVLLVIATVVRLGLGRPVLFRQMRSGLGGVPFQMIKFRTMRDLYDADGAPLPDAERVTSLGRFLRRSRLDELPELLNIARGEMDFVGPRPLLPHTVAAMGEAGAERGTVRPGLTGLAQVNGNTLLTEQEKLRLDLHYVRRRGPVRDAMILWRTVWVIIAGEKRTNWHDETRHPHRGG
jgi:lipopolysaccharide/colanic/teichoic acid biosynthesis glycosyltransferase